MPLARFHGVATAVGDDGESVVIAPYASVAVRREDTGALASLFSDRDGLVATANPITADEFGRFAFHVAGLVGGYRITVTEAGSPGTEYVFRYVPMGSLAELDNPLTTTGDLIIAVTGGVPARKAIGSDGAVLMANSSATGGASWMRMARGHLSGLTISNGAGSPTDSNELDIAEGGAMSSDGAYWMELAAAMTKRLNVAWSVGDGGGMLASGGAVANATYHIFLIARPDTGVVDIAADTSVSGVNIPTNTDAAYTKRRRIASMTRVGGAITRFKQDGDYFQLLTPVVDVSVSNAGNSAVNRTLASLPTGLNLIAELNVGLVSTAAIDAVYISDLDTDDLAPNGTNAPGFTTRNHVLNVNTFEKTTVRTSTTPQIRTRMATGASTDALRIVTLGWFDTRGRNA